MSCSSAPSSVSRRTSSSTPICSATRTARSTTSSVWWPVYSSSSSSRSRSSSGGAAVGAAEFDGLEDPRRRARAAKIEISAASGRTSRAVAGASAAAIAASRPSGREQRVDPMGLREFGEHDARRDPGGERSSHGLASDVGNELRGERGQVGRPAGSSSGVWAPSATSTTAGASANAASLTPSSRRALRCPRTTSDARVTPRARRPPAAGRSGVGSRSSIGTSTSCVGTTFPSPMRNSTGARRRTPRRTPAPAGARTGGAGVASSASATQPTSVGTTNAASTCISRRDRGRGLMPIFVAAPVPALRCGAGGVGMVGGPVARQVSYVVGRPDVPTLGA